MNQSIIRCKTTNPAPAPVQSDRPEALDVEWCAERAAEALRYLARHYPEAAGSEALHPHQDAAHQAAVAGDREAFLEALRGFMRAGRSVALEARRGAA